MTEATEAFAELTRQGHQVFTAAMQAWEQAARSMAGAAGRPGTQPPDMGAQVDAAFDFAAQMLADQREFTRTLMTAGGRPSRRPLQQSVAGAGTEPAADIPAHLATPGSPATPAPLPPTPAPPPATARRTAAGLGRGHRQPDRRHSHGCEEGDGHEGDGHEGDGEEGDGHEGDGHEGRPGGPAKKATATKATTATKAAASRQPGEDDGCRPGSRGEEDDREEDGGEENGGDHRHAGEACGAAERRDHLTDPAVATLPHASAAHVQAQREVAEQVRQIVARGVVQAVEHLGLGREVGGQQGIQPPTPRRR